MNQLIPVALSFRIIRYLIRTRDRELDDLGELSARQEIVAAASAIRWSLADDALDIDVICRVAEIQDRLFRLQTRAAKRAGQTVSEMMTQLDLKTINALTLLPRSAQRPHS